MLTAVVTSSGSTVEVTLLGDLVAVESEGTGETEVAENQLNPIAPEVKEMAWGFGAFVVLALAFRLWLVPKVRNGMAERYDSIQGDFEKAETLTASARAEVAEYEAQVASVRADAQGRVEAARVTLDAERNARLAEVNARIAEKRAAAAAEVDAARAAASVHVSEAVSSVTARAVELATGKVPSADTVNSAVDQAMGANA